jgi:hypothetical protein
MFSSASAKYAAVIAFSKLKKLTSKIESLLNISSSVADIRAVLNSQKRSFLTLKLA